MLRVQQTQLIGNIYFLVHMCVYFVYLFDIDGENTFLLSNNNITIHVSPQFNEKSFKEQ